MRICAMRLSERHFWHQLLRVQIERSVLDACVRIVPNEIYLEESIGTRWRLTVEYPRRPQYSHTWTSNWSDEIISRSVIKLAAPYDIRQSRSISPEASLLKYVHESSLVTESQTTVTRPPTKKRIRCQKSRPFAGRCYYPSVGWRVSLDQRVNHELRWTRLRRRTVLSDLDTHKSKD